MSAVLLFAAQENSTGYVEQIILPPRTELIDRKILEDSSDTLTASYKFRSQLSSDEILRYYRDVFSSINLNEGKDKQDGFYYFFNGSMDRVFLSIYYTDKDNLTHYGLDVYYSKYVYKISKAKFTRPQDIDFAPVNYQYTQALTSQSGSKGKFVQYISSDTAEEVADFYLQNMKTFNWELVSQDKTEGSGNLFETMAKGFNIPGAKEIFEREFPGFNASIKNIALVFKKNNSNCVVNITQFNDPPEVLGERRIINPEIISKYGNVIINVECGYEPKNIKTEQE